MSRIQDVRGRVVYDSRGFPTLEVEVETTDGVFRAIVPAASDGSHDAQELRDLEDKFGGKGVAKALKNVNNEIAVAITGMDPTDQEGIDQALIDLDGSPDMRKGRLGANAILGASMAVCRAGAAKKGIPLYKHLNNLAGNPTIMLPVPCFNVLSGGKGASNQLPIRELMILPTGAASFSQAMEIGVQIFHKLKKIILLKYGLSATSVGDEGGFEPAIKSTSEALKLVKEAITQAGFKDSVQVALDVAGSELYAPEKRRYNLGAGGLKTAEEMLRMYKEYAAMFDVISIEDPFHSEDAAMYSKMTGELNELIQIVGDDLLSSNPDLVDKASEGNECNGALLRLISIGTVTEAIDTNTRARDAGFGVMVSHSTGDSEDTFIADLAVGLGTGQLKAGAPCRSDRMAKYNELLRIEDDLKEQVQFAGEYWRDPWLLPKSRKKAPYM